MLRKVKALFEPPVVANIVQPKQSVRKNPAFDFKGKRWVEPQNMENPLGLQRDNLIHQSELYEPKMQTRVVRYKSLGYMVLAILWNAFVISFIMYRMGGGEDLQRMAEEAMEKVEKSKVKWD